jgi:hypothetical protein
MAEKVRLVMCGLLQSELVCVRLMARRSLLRTESGNWRGGRLLYGVDVEGYAEKRTEKRTN